MLWHVLTALAASAGASGNEPNALTRADALYERYEFADALNAYEAALASPRSSREWIERGYIGVGMCSAALGRSARATWAFVRVLSLDPGWRPAASASPKFLEPVREARAFWSTRRSPRLDLSAPVSAVAGQSVDLDVALVDDELHLAERVAVRWSQGNGPNQMLGVGAQGGHLTFLPTAGGGAEVRVQAEALDEQGSIVYQTAPRIVRLVAATEPSQPTVAAVLPPEVEKTVPVSAAARPFARVRVSASMVGDLVSRQLGGEAAAAWSPASWLDLGASVLPGRDTGFRLVVTLHPTHAGPNGLAPLLQLRAGVHTGADGAFAAEGVALGGTYEVGPGRVVLQAVGELYQAPANIWPVGVLVSAGYQLDLVREYSTGASP
jgi:hypothetical protein